MTKNILLIGTGNIGKRWLEGILKVNNDMIIYLLDIDNEKIDEAKQKYSATNHFNYKIINKLQDDRNIDEFEIVIIATDSKVRFGIIVDLIKKYKIKNLILEKILFQQKKHYLEAFELLKDIKVYVNVGNQLKIDYEIINRKLKETLPLNFKYNSLPLRIEVTGINWGMACNAIHYIEFIRALQKIDKFKFSSSEIVKKIYDSKRNGFIEFAGKVIIKNDINNENLLSLSCSIDKSNSKFVSITLIYKTINIIIEYNNSRSKSLFYIVENDSKKTEYKFDGAMVSMAAQTYIHDILTKNHCGLPEYKDHYLIAMDYLDFFLNEAKNIKPSNNWNSLNIT